MIIVNVLAVSICLYTFKSLHEGAYFDFHERNGYYEGIKFRPLIVSSRRAENECVTYRRFAGRWRVVEREIGQYGLDIPTDWIELYPWGRLHAGNNSWQKPLEGGWQPPYQSRYSDDKNWRNGYIWTDDFDAPWDFDMQGDLLILTSPSEYFQEWEGSRVVLERDLSE